MVTSDSEHFTLDVKSFDRVRVGGDRFVDQLVSLGGFRSVQQPRKPYFRPRGLGIKLDCFVQQRFGLGLIVQARGCNTERGPDFALKDRVPPGCTRSIRSANFS